MQLQQLHYFLTIADCGSINKASTKLLISQPNLSKAIKDLEKELQVQVFIRKSSGVFLTEEGRQLYEYAQTIFKQVRLINNIHIEQKRDSVTIATYPVLSVSRVMRTFNDQYNPQNLISLKVLECRIAQVLNHVETGTADIGFLYFNTLQKKNFIQLLNAKKLSWNYICEDRGYALMGPQHPLYSREQVTLQELSQYPLIRYPDDFFSDMTAHQQIDDTSLMDLPSHFTDSSMLTLDLLRNSNVYRLGIGLTKEDYLQYGIRTIPIVNNDIRITIGWIRRNNYVLSDATTHLTEILASLH